ncbi:MAPK/MAK/MRK overlapping kinase, partial [Oenanthe melanoleuca]|uniref:MAPK/MAK/MRK overlapping kinase n=1 Tax=Oenanthe melanoleuca TaxID=2939378 RepID=UPI0024C18AC5
GERRERGRVGPAAPPPSPAPAGRHERHIFIFDYSKFSDENPGSLSLVCEFMPMNIYELMKGRRKPLPGKKKSGTTCIRWILLSLAHTVPSRIFIS